MKHFQSAEIKAASSREYDATFVVSAATPDRVQDTIEPKAYGPNLHKTLPALFAHDHTKIAGAWHNLRVEGEKLLGDLRLAPTGVGLFIKKLLEGDFPISASIGFSGRGKRNAKGGTHFEEIDLHEVSLVAVPCHASAQRVKALGAECGVDDEVIQKFVSPLSVGDDEEAASGRNLEEILQKSRAATLAANRVIRMKRG
jgi:HK97 family phage prohead protease